MKKRLQKFLKILKNRVHILLLAGLKQAKGAEAQARKKALLEMMDGDIELRSKRELIEKFIEEHLPKIDDVDSISDENRTLYRQN